MQEKRNVVVRVGARGEIVTLIYPVSWILCLQQRMFNSTPQFTSSSVEFLKMCEQRAFVVGPFGELVGSNVSRSVSFYS
jgi:hypothetical protein